MVPVQSASATNLCYILLEIASYELPQCIGKSLAREVDGGGNTWLDHGQLDPVMIQPGVVTAIDFPNLKPAVSEDTAGFNITSTIFFNGGSRSRPSR